MKSSMNETGVDSELLETVVYFLIFLENNSWARKFKLSWFQSNWINKA